MILSLLNQLLFVALAATCNQQENPHSFACVDQAFFGKHFPMVDLSEQRVQGKWKFVTIATPDGSSQEFSTVIDRTNPRVPVAVRNRSDNSLSGPMMWNGTHIQFQNWQQERGDLDSQNVKFCDQWTLQAEFPNDSFLQCRIFIRSKTDHMVCLWFDKSGEEFVKRGYLGFLKTR